jgi:hypothetical protein
MRALVAGFALATIATLSACGGGGSTTTSGSIVGTWTLQTYVGQPLPFTGSPNEDGSVNRVDSGSIAFDANKNYALGIKIVNTRGSTVTRQDFDEVGSYSGTASSGVILKPNDLSGGTSTQIFATVPVTVSGNTLSFSQQGKILTFVKR